MSDLLFLAHRIPFPPDRGDKIRSWHLLKALGEMARIDLACFADDAADAAHLPALREAVGGAPADARPMSRYGAPAGRWPGFARSLPASRPR